MTTCFRYVITPRVRLTKALVSISSSRYWLHHRCSVILLYVKIFYSFKLKVMTGSWKFDERMFEHRIHKADNLTDLILSSNEGSRISIRNSNSIQLTNTDGRSCTSGLPYIAMPRTWRKRFFLRLWILEKSIKPKWQVEMTWRIISITYDVEFCFHFCIHVNDCKIKLKSFDKIN